MSEVRDGSVVVIEREVYYFDEGSAFAYNTLAGLRKVNPEMKISLRLFEDGSPGHLFSFQDIREALSAE